MQNKKTIHEVLTEAREQYRIEEADSETKERMINFFKMAYAGQFNAADYTEDEKIIKRWEWANVKNPNIFEGQFPAWFCKDDRSNKIVGHLGIIPVMLKFKNTYHPAVWGRDMIVPQIYRGKGICSLMFDTALKLTDGKVGMFLLAGLNDYAAAIYRKLGFKHLGHIPLYIRVNNVGSLVRNRMGSSALAILLETFGKLLLKIIYMPSYFRRLMYSGTGTFSIIKVRYFDKTFDNLWENAAQSFPIIVKRDSAYLNWRFINQPYWRYEIFKAEHKTDKEVKGYIILRTGKSRGFRVGVISDIFAHAADSRTISFLIDFAIRYFKQKKDIDLIRCDISHRNFEKALKKSGFIKIQSKSHFMVANIRQEMDSNFVVNRDNWFISYGDCDMDLSNSP